MNADPIARAYRWVEYLAFGRALERCRFSLLPAAQGARRVLILGEGDGRFLGRILSGNPTATVDVVESSAAMIKIAESRISAADRARVRFVRRDAVHSAMPGSDYDVVVTNFFLDCLDESDAATVVNAAAVALKPAGRWLIAEFQQPSAGFARIHASLWLAVMYSFFRWTTGLEARQLPDYAARLRRLGFRLSQHRQWRLGLIVAQVWTRSTE